MAECINCIYERGLLALPSDRKGQCEKPQKVRRQQIQTPTLFLSTNRQREDDRGNNEHGNLLKLPNISMFELRPSLYACIWIVVIMLAPTFVAMFDEAIMYPTLVLILLAPWWGHKRFMPKTQEYERAMDSIPMLENLYTNNIKVIYQTIVRNAVFSAILTLYVVTILVCSLLIVYTGDQLITKDDIWNFAFTLFIAVLAIWKSARDVRKCINLKNNCTQETCRTLIESKYKVSYSNYFFNRCRYSYEGSLPSKPRHYTIFIAITAAIALLSVDYGLSNIFGTISLLLSDEYNIGVSRFLGGMAFGMVFVVVGVVDIVSCFRNGSVAFSFKPSHSRVTS